MGKEHRASEPCCVSGVRSVRDESMRIARNLSEAAGFGPSAVTIGNFDGVHLGHRVLIEATVQEARARNVRSVVMMFSPHPAHVVAPHRAPRIMMTPEERCEVMADLGIDAVLIVPFNVQLASLSPHEFAAQYLRDALKAKIVLVGDNFRFGAKQSGSTDTLAELGLEMGFETRFISAVHYRGRMVSASAVRRLVCEGRVSRAGRLLGRPYEIAGDVVSGRGIGRKETVPTINMRTDAQVLPEVGVYITRLRDAAPNHEAGAGRAWNGITNIGYRPTFADQNGLTIETYILDEFKTDAKLERIYLAFLRHVRDERKFGSPELLKAQILRDVGRANAYFRRMERWVKRAKVGQKTTG